jgi:hypothetical protein
VYFKTTQEIFIGTTRFPEFYDHRSIMDVVANVFHADCHYNLIIGHDILDRIGMPLDFETHSMTWDNQTISMCVLPPKPDPTLLALSLLLDAHEETPPDFLDNDDDS